MSLSSNIADRFRGFRWAALVLAVGIGLFPLRTVAQPRPTASEYPLKAVFLLNFTKFVEWPTNAFANAAAPFVLGIAGQDPFGSALEAAFAGQTVAGHAILVRHYTNEAVGQDCHLLFVSHSEKDRQTALLAGLRDRRLLTVGESDQFLETGGVINFVIVKERVRFEVNSSAAERAGLKLSAKLLGVAVRVISDKGEK